MENDFNLFEYMSNGIQNIISNALKASINNPKQTAFIMKYMLASKAALKNRKKYESQGQHIPPFLIASITKSCNLFCKGCYARANKLCGENSQDNQLSDEKWSDIFNQARELGISFILLAGGEPLMRKDVIKRASKIKEIIFPIFTNGTMIDDSYIKEFDHNRNLIPVLSIEGDEKQTNERRGEGTYHKLMTAMEKLTEAKIFYGASVTVTKENINTVTGKDFIDMLYKAGCKIVFFIEYVPVTAATKDIAPGEADRIILENEQTRLRTIYKDMLFLSFPGDEKHTGGCLAAGRGFFHINADGGAEPCPFSPYSDTSLKKCSLLEALQSPLFKKLDNAGMLLGEHDGGCLLFEKEDEVRELIATDIE